MKRKQRYRRGAAMAVLFLVTAILACGPSVGAGEPSITITSPPSGATVAVGEVVEIASTAVADAGVARVELLVNGAVVRSDEPPSGNPTTFTVVQPWTPTAEGEVTISAVAYDATEAASNPARIALWVQAVGAEPTPTPVEDVSGPGGCTLNASFVTDVTVPDYTEMSPGEPFVKTWRIHNSGTCDWGAGFSLVFASGNQMGGPESVPVPPTAAGSDVDTSVNLVAPSTPGTYEGNWQMLSADGVLFGSVLYVKIVVPVPATVPPAESPTPTEVPTTSPCVAPDPALEPILDHAEASGYSLGCPIASASSVYGAFQEFWANIHEVNPHLHFRSLMIWRSDNREIYVIDGEDTDASKGTLLAYTDTWEESQPEVHPDCAAMTPPAGYELPIRGFGKVWCVNNLEDPVGWPAVPEAAVSLLVQPTQTGLLLKVSGPISIGYLVALDYQAVRAVTMMTPP